MTEEEAISLLTEQVITAVEQFGYPILERLESTLMTIRHRNASIVQQWAREMGLGRVRVTSKTIAAMADRYQVMWVELWVAAQAEQKQEKEGTDQPPGE